MCMIVHMCLYVIERNKERSELLLFSTHLLMDMYIMFTRYCCVQYITLFTVHMLCR